MLFRSLVTTAESHHRVMIMEVMGRDAGWIALHTAIAGGAEVCLIPEIPYNVNKLVERINKRYQKGRGFVNIVIAEGAIPKDGTITAGAGEKGSEHVRLGGVAFQLSKQLKDAGCKAEIRETVLGHTQRGGVPVAFDRVLASLFGVKAFELVLNGKTGQMVALKNNSITSVTLEEAALQVRELAATSASLFLRLAPEAELLVLRLEDQLLLAGAGLGLDAAGLRLGRLDRLRCPDGTCGEAGEGAEGDGDHALRHDDGQVHPWSSDPAGAAGSDLRG